jgi:2-haloacid dehalogenase
VGLRRPSKITDGEFDFMATDFLDLADQLGATSEPG